MGTIRTNVICDRKIWDEARTIAREELNLNMSKFIEIMLRQFVNSRSKSQKEMMEDMIDDLWSAAHRPKRKPK